MSFAGAAWGSLRRELAYLARSGWDLALLSILPLLAIVAMAATFSSGVIRNIPVAVVDMDRSALSRAMERNLSAHPKIRVAALPADLAAALPLVRSGKVLSVVFIPPGLEQAARRREDGAVAIYFNAAFQTAGSQAADAARAAVQAAVSANVLPTGAGDGEARVHLNPVKVQVTLAGDPEQSFELFLAALVAPCVLNLLASCAAVFAVGRELTDASLAAWVQASGGRVWAALIGKLAPYVLAFWAWMLAWTAYLAGWRGWDVQGSLGLLILAQLLLLCATAAIGAFLVAGLRDLDTALSISALYAGSALSFAGATLPVNGASLFTRIWTDVLPSTSYIRVQEQQLVMGAPAWSSAAPLGVLLLFILVPLAIAVPRLKRLATRAEPGETFVIPPLPDAFAPSFLGTLRAVATTKPILSTIVFSVILYGFYYPSAYKVQTAVKLPVAVVDLDRSPLSRSFLRKLDATRETHVVVQADSIAAGQALLQEDRVDGVVVVSDGLEASVLKNAPGGIAAYLKGAYLVRSRFLGQALSAAVQASVEEVLAPLATAARGGGGEAVRVIERPLFNTANGYGDYTVPGVASVILQATLLFGVAMYMGMRREGERWRMGAKTFFGVWAAFTALGTLTSLFFFGFVLWFQDYPRAGNLPGLLVCAPLFAGTVSAMALLIGSAFRRHERSMQILAGTSVPLYLLSGLSWPVFAMPPAIQAIAQLAPSTSAVPMFVLLNSAGASLAEVAPWMARLSALLLLYLLAAFLILAE